MTETRLKDLDKEIEANKVALENLETERKKDIRLEDEVLDLTGIINSNLRELSYMPLSQSREESLMNELDGLQRLTKTLDGHFRDRDAYYQKTKQSLLDKGEELSYEKKRTLRSIEEKKGDKTNG
ncbi:hypothetical protein [Streptococcus loxodontisalivarius]|uniref:Uncharacterized protein n=1 Tax=Streptococcus loxodontisalivarius TaxID=1349415 RepID=A0ABS2PUQ9_9STRE|nr:hypothetical protein [Streptococcus loxodontisalivarius]MBM7643057.1 hypothetical protein [Streptococcus loxodontisalivarius]